VWSKYAEEEEEEEEEERSMDRQYCPFRISQGRLLSSDL